MGQINLFKVYKLIEKVSICHCVKTLRKRLLIDNLINFCYTVFGIKEITRPCYYGGLWPRCGHGIMSKGSFPISPIFVPAVFIMANSIDQSHHRAVTTDQVSVSIEETMEEKDGVQIVSHSRNSTAFLVRLFFGAIFSQKMGN